MFLICSNFILINLFSEFKNVYVKLIYYFNVFQKGRKLFLRVFELYVPVTFICSTPSTNSNRTRVKLYILFHSTCHAYYIPCRNTLRTLTAISEYVLWHRTSIRTCNFALLTFILNSGNITMMWLHHERVPHSNIAYAELHSVLVRAGLLTAVLLLCNT